MWRSEPLLEREDVDAMLAVLFDMQRELKAIRKLLEDDGEPEAEAES